jgi:hypothetical protein
MVAKLTRPTHKIATQLHLVAESCTICCSCSRRSVRKLLDTHSYFYIILQCTLISPGWSLPFRISKQVLYIPLTFPPGVQHFHPKARGCFESREEERSIINYIWRHCTLYSCDNEEHLFHIPQIQFLKDNCPPKDKRVKTYTYIGFMHLLCDVLRVV